MGIRIYKNKLILLLVLMSILVFSLFNCGCLEPENEKTRITSKKALKEAENASNLQNSKAILEHVTSVGEPKKGGRSPSWRFSYLGPLENGTYSGFEVTITGELKSEIDIEGYVNKSKRDPKPIKNWTLDSDEAIEIAKDNPKIKKYLDGYEDAYVESMYLEMWPDYSKEDTIWKIDWMYNAGFDNPKNARAIINAHTGEVIEAEADT